MQLCQEDVADREITHQSVELTFDTASFMLTPESAGFQKDPHQKASVASVTVGSLVHTGTKDFHTMEDKILSLIQSNYLQTTLQQSAEDRHGFQEYLEKLATGVPVEGCLVISVGCDSLENLEGVVRRLLIWHS